MPAHAPPHNPVMVVDDNDDIRDSMAELLKIGGYQVVCARNGREALDKLTEGTRPCLILLDADMPVMNGIAFRKAQLAEPAWARIPVALYSANDQIGPSARSLGFVEFFQKPIDFARLFDAVAHHCKRDDE